MKYGWTDTRECIPLEDGLYLVQTVYGDTTPMHYTFKGGWNTYYEEDVLCATKRLEDEYIARWYRTEKPPKVPALWKQEYFKKKGVI